MLLELVAEASLPTPWANFRVIGFKELLNGQEHLALTLGEFTAPEPTLARIHSECLTGDALFSLRCDCGFQLQDALKQIADLRRGVLIYHRQEGRGIGLLNKIRAYSLQDGGSDTVEANHRLGFAADERDFTICALIFNMLQIKSLRLLTNNPQKVSMLTSLGIDVVERVPLQAGRNSYNENYLLTKATKLGHLLDFDLNEGASRN